MFTLNCKGRLLVIDKPIVMGIINTTPDSFFEGSRITNTDDVLRTAERMINDGATIIDIGGQSSKPGAERISADEELKRVIDPLNALHKAFPQLIISIDSFYARVAEEAVAAGASIVNDISAGAFDESMLEIVASLKVPYVLMHMKGNPVTMNGLAQYDDVTREVLDFMIWKLKMLTDSGIRDIIIDPGFGFAKTAAQNFRLLKDLSVFNILERPLLLGISRKSTVYRTLNIEASEALNGSTVLQTIGLLHGARIIRTHDVKEAMEAIKLVSALEQA